VTENWKLYKLRQVCKLINGRAYSQPELLAEGAYPVLRVGNFFTNNHWYYSDLELDSSKYCDTGDLLYAWSASFGPRIWNGGKVIFHYHIWKVEPDDGLVDKKFLYWWFLWDADLIRLDQGAGTTMTHVSKGSMDDRNLFLPDLADQRRIAAILDEAFEGIATAKANAEKNLQNARAIFESHLQRIFRNRGETWEERTLGEISSVKGGKRVPKGYKLTTEPTNHPYLRVTEFSDSGSIDMSALRYVSAEVHRQIRRYVIYSSDLYISIAGTIGKTGIIPAELDGANLTENACRLVFHSGISNLFVYYFTTTQDFAEQAGLNTRTSAQPKLALSRLATIRLGIPSTYEQQELAYSFEKLRVEIRRLESIYERKIAALERLKKSLLYQAFAGRL
jgi:type I restriction enzyme S subunit